MKHHGQTTSDTTSIGSSVAAALAGADIGLSSMFEEKIGRQKGKGNTTLSSGRSAQRLQKFFDDRCGVIRRELPERLDCILMLLTACEIGQAAKSDERDLVGIGDMCHCCAFHVEHIGI